MLQRRRPQIPRRKPPLPPQVPAQLPPQPSPPPEGARLYAVHLPSAVAAAVDRQTLTVLGLDSDISVMRVVGQTGQYEPHVMEAIVRFLPPGGTFIDVGANFGIHSLLAAARVGATGRVLAVEASPICHLLLTQNLAASGCPGAVAVHAAAWSRPGVMSFRHLTQIVGGSHVTFTGRESPWDAAQYRVLGVPLDTLVALAGLERVDLIKVDVEGAEYQVLEGGAETLRRHRPTIILEFNPITAQYYEGHSARDLHRLVRELGYHMTLLNPGLAGESADDYAVMDRLWRLRMQVLDVICTPA